MQSLSLGIVNCTDPDNEEAEVENGLTKAMARGVAKVAVMEALAAVAAALKSSPTAGGAAQKGKTWCWDFATGNCTEANCEKGHLQKKRDQLQAP